MSRTCDHQTPPNSSRLSKTRSTIRTKIRTKTRRTPWNSGAQNPRKRHGHGCRSHRGRESRWRCPSHQARRSPGVCLRPASCTSLVAPRPKPTPGTFHTTCLAPRFAHCHCLAASVPRIGRRLGVDPIRGRPVDDNPRPRVVPRPFGPPRSITRAQPTRNGVQTCSKVSASAETNGTTQTSKAQTGPRAAFTGEVSQTHRTKNTTCRQPLR